MCGRILHDRRSWIPGSRDAARAGLGTPRTGVRPDLLIDAVGPGQDRGDVGTRIGTVGALILVWTRCREVVVATGGVHTPDRVQVGREEVADRVARGRPPDHRIPGKDVPRHVAIEGGLLA